MDFKIKKTEPVKKELTIQSDLLEQVQKFSEVLKKHNPGDISLDETVGFLLKHALETKEITKELKDKKRLKNNSKATA